ncbi:MAG: hypothetical protein BWY74_00070 [Firmicutes bacterium ADurb.Bin419]|nr:MAG: hypothetical protein BWY74_00070 [Firmicutes bacterium ADurb.Bin419]
MEKILWILKFSSYAVLLYIGWLIFDYYITHRRNRKKK